MILETHIPKFPLKRFIDHFIYYEGYELTIRRGEQTLQVTLTPKKLI